MRPGGIILLLVGCGAVWLSAQEANAPLSNTRQQLQSLKKDQTAERAKTDSPLELRGALPTLNTPGDTPPAAFDPKVRRGDSDRDTQRKADARKNWLLDGVEKLDRKKNGVPREESDRDDPDEKPLDPSDPDYFLRVYEKQRADNLAKQEQARGADSKSLGGASGSADAFAPFMQDWLAGSPVRDALKDVIGPDRGERPGLADSARADGIASGRTESGSLNIGASSRQASADKKGEAAVNPFLQALGLSSDMNGKGAEIRATSAPPVFIPPPAPRAELTTPELPKAETRLRPPRSPADDRKYFPQLKKF
ncbi:MAG: hypothetical protein C0518_10910 [Opitutus sp.]|nr:hypothetical protein [Opitutus sp.]